IQGPDFPTGGIVTGVAPIRALYETGRGILRMRARVDVETDKKTGRDTIVVTEVPYQVNKARAIQSIAELGKEKGVEGISDLRDAQEREHILLGYKIALDHIDEMIAVIKASANREIASTQLQSLYGLSELQAKAILEMQLQRLTGLEKQKIVDELDEAQKLITRLAAILGSEELLLKVIKDELREVKKDFADARRTEIVGEASDLSDEDRIADEDMVVTVSHAGYVNRNPVSLYRAQKRGGKGKTGAMTAEDDFIEQI